jgi:nicotinamidase-related amidase
VPDHTEAGKARLALVLMDFQPALLASLGDRADALLGNAETALRWARANQLPVAHVRVAFRESDYDAIPARNKAFMTVKSRRAFKEGSPETEIVGSLKPAADEIVVRKTRIGSFSTTDLGAQLRDAGVDTLVLAGIRTSGVVLSTVRDAADQDFGIYVLRDGCADSDGHVHEVLTESVFPHQAHVITTGDLEALR